VAGVHAWVLADRGLGRSDEARPAMAQAADADPGDWDGSLTMLSFNTYMGRAKVIDLALEVRQVAPDVVVLLEASEELTQQLLELTGQDGFSFTAFTAGDGGSSLTTTVLVSAAIGPYEQGKVSGMGHGAVYLTPAGGDELNGHARPTILGVHTIAPLPSTMELWRQSVEKVVERCQSPQAGLVVAGDFNATLDHAVMRELGGCADAAVQAGWWPGDLAHLDAYGLVRRDDRPRSGGCGHMAHALGGGSAGRGLGPPRARRRAGGARGSGEPVTAQSDDALR